MTEKFELFEAEDFLSMESDLGGDIPHHSATEQAAKIANAKLNEKGTLLVQPTQSNITGWQEHNDWYLGHHPPFKEGLLICPRETKPKPEPEPKCDHKINVSFKTLEGHEVFFEAITTGECPKCHRTIPRINGMAIQVHDDIRC